MKKLILLVVLLSLSVGAMGAGGMYPTFAGAAIQIREKLGYTTATSNIASDSACYNHIREGVLTVSPLVRAKQKSQSVTTTYRTQSYVLDTLTIGIDWVAWSKNDSTKSLLFVPRERWFEMEHKTTTSGTGFLKRPSYYDYTHDSVGMTIFLYPVPTLKDADADTILVMSHLRRGDLDTSITLTYLPEEYRSAVVKYATWKLAQARQHPSTEMFHQEYVEQINVIRSLDRGYKVEKATP